MHKPKLDRKAWLIRALEVLLHEGVQGVRIERLARDLEVTKGSFYWHFQDREDLLKAVLEFWSDAYNDIVLDNPEFQQGDAGRALLSAMKRVRREGLDRYELALRAWAADDATANRVVKKVYAKRMRFIRSCFERIGFRGMEAEIRTRLMLCYMSWEPSMFAKESKSKRLRLLELQHELLTQLND
jgi:AcrR family transcriptional regulator